MEENLLDGDLTTRQFRLLEEADSFDLDEFYHNLGASNGAVCLITKNQMLMTDCYYKIPGNKYGKHYDTVNEMYQALYGVRAKPTITSENGEKILWQTQVVQDGNIIIQLCSSVTTLVWVPKELGDEQKIMFENFVKRMYNIIKNDQQYFDENPIEIAYIIEDAVEFGTSLNDFNVILDIINNKKRR